MFLQPPFNESPVERLNSREALIRAQGLLEEAGWVLRDTRLTNTAGDGFAIEFLVNTPSHQRLLLTYVDRLERLGIATKIRLVESAQYINLRRTNRGDGVFGSLGISYPPSQEVPAYFSSRSLGAGNFAKLSSPVVDVLSEKVVGATTRRDLIAACHALDRVLYWQFYYIPVRALEGLWMVLWDKYGRPEKQSRSSWGFNYINR